MIFLLAVGASGLLTLAIYLIVFLLIFWLFYYIINNLAPEPFRRILNVVLIVLFVLVLCYFLLGLVGGGSSLRL